MLFLSLVKFEGMSVKELKQKIHDAIEKTNDEDQLIRVLDVLESDEDEVPDWHKNILEERWVEYQKSPDKVISYEEWNRKMKEKYGI